jgi:MSHA biogenesis protein MshN
MSLINSMLRDLEARRSDGTAAAPFQGQVRAVPARPAPTMKFKLGAVAGGAVLLAVAAVGGQRLWQAPAAPAAVAAPAPPVAPQQQVPAAQQEAVAAVKPAAAVNAPAARAQEASEATGKVIPAVASRPAAMPAPASPAAPTASAITATAATATAVAASAKPAAQPTTAATPASAEPAVQTTSAGNEPGARPAKRQAMLPAGAAPQAQQRNEEAPLQPAAALVSPAAEPLKIVREAMPQADMAMQLARQQLQDNALREAIDTLQRALPQAGARADYHAFLAALLQRDDQHRSAAEHYATALRSAPDNGVWGMGLGISYQALQMSTQAQQAYRSAQASRSLNPELAAFVEARLGQLQRP